MELELAYLKGLGRSQTLWLVIWESSRVSREIDEKIDKGN